MKERIRYFDVIKGMAIYAVVMGHVMVYGAKGLNQAWLMTVIGLTHMPLFFFISGWF